MRAPDPDPHRPKARVRRYPTNPADIWALVTYGVILLGIMVVFLMYRTILSMNELRLINSDLIQIWREVSRQIEFVTGNPEGQIAGPSLFDGVKQRLSELIELGLIKEGSFQSILARSTALRGVFELGQGVSDAEMLRLSVDPELVRRSFEVRDAPNAIFSSGFAYWPTDVTISIQSERYIEPLLQRMRLLASESNRLFRILYIELAVLAAILSACLAAIWRLYLRPAIRDLGVARAELQFVLDNAPARICSLTPDGIFRSANQSYLEYAGLADLPELRGRHLGDVLGKDRWDVVRDQIIRTRNQPGIKFEVEREIDGQNRLLLVSYDIQQSLEGRGEEVIALLVDITEVDRTRQALSLSEERLRITLESIGDAVISTDVDGGVVEINSRAAELTGWPADQARGRPLQQVFNIVNAKTRARAVDPVELVLRENTVVGLANDTMLLARDGAEYQIADSGAPIRDRQGATVGVVLVFRDVTEDYRLRAALGQAETLKSVGLLAGGVAHDFNNLLAGIQGNVDLIAITTPDHLRPVTAGRLDEIERLIRHGAGLTEHLIQFAQTRPPKMTPVDMCHLVEECLDLLRKTTDRRIVFELDCDCEVCTVLGDESVLQAAVMNVLINSVDSIPAAGVVRVEMRNIRDGLPEELMAELKPDQIYVSILISDTGSGIAATDLPRVFDPFFTTKAFGKGVGLGLPAAFGTVRNHNGDISIASTVGEGTRLRIMLPAWQGEMPQPADPVLPAGAGDSQSSLTILFADDEPSMRDTAVALLTTAEHRVILAVDGQDCVRKFALHRDEIDIVVIDLNMPYKSGAEAIAEITAMKPGTRFVVISGHSRDTGAFPDGNAANLRFLSKPFRFSQLLTEIKALVASGTPGP